MVAKNELQKLRHPKEKLIFWMAAIPILVSIFGFLAWWTVSPHTLENIIATNLITEEVVIDFIADDPVDTDSVDSSTEQIILEVSDEDRKDAQFIRDILVPIVASPITPISIIILFILLLIVLVGNVYGKSLGNGVKLSRKQFPEVYNMVDEMAQEIGMKTTPDIILQNGNGQLNAFACNMPMIRNVIVIYSDIFERCVATGDMKTLRFVLGHELGHIHFGHVKWWYHFVTMPLSGTPVVNYIFGRGLSRAREYSCDKLGAHLSGDTDGTALMILSAGKHNYQEVDIDTFVEDQNQRNIWVTFANFFMDHPINAWRILAINKKYYGGIWLKKK